MDLFFIYCLQRLPNLKTRYIGRHFDFWGTTFTIYQLVKGASVLMRFFLPYAYLRIQKNSNFTHASKFNTIDKKRLFCSTGLPLARTRWVRLTFSSHGPLSSNQRHWFTSAKLIIFPLKKIRECCESNLGLLGEKQKCYLRAMHPPPNYYCLCLSGN